MEFGKCELHAHAYLTGARLLWCQRLRKATALEECVTALLEQRAGLQLWVECLAVWCAGLFKRLCVGSAVTENLSFLALLFLFLLNRSRKTSVQDLKLKLA